MTSKMTLSETFRSRRHHHLLLPHHHHRRDVIILKILLIMTLTKTALTLEAGEVFDTKASYFLSNTPVGCEYFPCKNKGTCVQLAGGEYSCKCPNAFGGKNCELVLSACTCFGATHCQTFDGAFIDYPGQCRFLLSRFDDSGKDPISGRSESVSVFARRQPSSANSKVVYVAGFDVVFGAGGFNATVLLVDNVIIKVKVNGINVELPYHTDLATTGSASSSSSGSSRSSVDIYYVTSAIVRFQMGNGLRIDFSRNWLIKILAPHSFKSRMSGLCGNFDDVSTNDYVTRFGLNASNSKNPGIEIGNSFVDDDTKPFKDCQFAAAAVATDAAKCSATIQKSGQTICSYLDKTSYNSFIFVNCLDVLEPTFLQKLRAACLEDFSKTCNLETALVSLRNFATSCNNMGVLLADWSALLGDACTCPNSKMTCPRKVSGCVDTCLTALHPGQSLFRPNEQCLLQTYNNVCECPYGSVFHNGSCIPADDCGCVDSETGKVYKINEVWLSADCSLEFSCTRNNIITSRSKTCAADKECVDGVCRGCTPSKCPNGTCFEFSLKSLCLCKSGYISQSDSCVPAPQIPKPTIPSIATCVVSTGQHVTTFDGYRLDYRGNCRYLLLSNNSTSSSSVFSIYVNSINLPRTRNISYVQAVEMNYKGSLIKLEKKLDSNSYLVHLSINGTPIELPLLNKNFDFTVLFNGDYVEIQTSFGLTVSYNPLWRLKVTLTSAFSNQVTGSCGNFDGNPSNDVKMANGALAREGDDGVVASFVVRCPTSANALTPPLCGQSPQTQKCEPIIDENGPFRECIKLMGIQKAGQLAVSCVDDVISSCSDVTACHFLEHFSRSCYEAGSPVDSDWREVLSCPTTCPDPSMERALMTTACRTTCNYKTCTIVPNQATDICICPSGTVLFNGTCITEQECGCLDSSGSAQQLGSSWLTNTCTKKGTCLLKNNIRQGPFKCPSNTTCAGNTCSACFSNPCLNDGTCLDVSSEGDYACKCKPGFSGTNCNNACNDMMDVIIVIDNTPTQCQDDPTYSNQTCSQWQAVLDYVGQVVTYLQIGSASNNVALVKLASRASLVGRGLLNSTSVFDSLFATKISSDPGPANIESALQFIKSNILARKTFDRMNATNYILFVLNSWVANDFGIDIELSSVLFDGSKYFVVLTNRLIPLDSVANLVSRSSTRNFFLAPSIAEISSTKEFLENSFNLCAATKLVKCSVIGDGRAETFDGLKMEYKGLCKYLLFSYESSTLNLTVHLKNYRPYPNGNIVYPKSLEVSVNGLVVKLERRLQAIGSLVNLWVDGIERSPPFKTSNFSVHYNGDSLELSTNSGFVASLSKLYHVKILVNPTFKNRVKGYCGNYDGDASNDLRTSSGEVVVRDSNKVFGTTIGYSYVVSEELLADGSCSQTTAPKTCPKRVTECSVINDPSGVFGPCAKKFPALALQYREQCEEDILDLCQPMSGIECQAYAEFDRVCQDREVFINWRTPLSCDSQCPEDMLSVVRGVACLPTCSNPDAARTCLLPDVADSCTCSANKVLFNQRCIDVKKCGCMDEFGREHSLGDVWLSHNCTKKHQCDNSGNIASVQYACQKDSFCDNEHCLGCNRPLDIAFIIDESSSVCLDDANIHYADDGQTIVGCDSWTYVLQAMANILKDLTIGPNDVQVAVIKFGTTASLMWNLDGFKTMSTLLEAISKLTYLGGFTNMAAALRVMRTEVFGSPADRPQAENLLIFVTDGVPTIELQALPEEVFEAYLSNIKRVAIGITNFIDERNLMMLCDPPHQKDKNYFIARGFDEVEYLRKNVQAGINVCPDTHQYTCECWGDTHCRTFDGLHLDYPGLCRTQLSQSDSLNYPFSIFLKNYRSIYSNYSSFVGFIEVNITGDVVRLEKFNDSWTGPVIVSINDRQITVPYRHSKFSLDFNGEYLELSTNYGLAVGFSSKSRFYIDLPKTLSYSVSGLCGNFDDNQANDVTMADKTPATNLDSPGKEVGDSYLAVDPSSLPSCKTPPPKPPPCDLNLEPTCAKIIDQQGPFSACISLLGEALANLYYQQCLDDLPKSCSKDGVCMSVENFVEKCRGDGWVESEPSKWRDLLKCSCTCDNPDMYCRPVGPPCINTCVNQTASSQCMARDVHDVCVCRDPGKVYSGGQCVHPSTCGCVDRMGKSRKVGDVYLESSCTLTSKCEAPNVVTSMTFMCPDGNQCYQEACNPCLPNNPCSNGGRCEAKLESKYICLCPDGYFGRNCEKERKTGTCRLWQGVDLLTFDTAFISYNGTQKYLLTRGTFEKNQFFIYAKNYQSCDEDSTHIAYVRYVEFVYNGFKVHMERKEDETVFSTVLVVVNDVLVSLPYKNQHFSIEYVAEFVQIKTFFGLLLGFSSLSRVKITLPSIPSFTSNVRGLCGNFDTSPTNDFITEAGVDVSSSGSLLAGQLLVTGFDSYVSDKALDAAYFETCDETQPWNAKDCPQLFTLCDEIINSSGVFLWCNALLEPSVIVAFRNSCLASYNKVCQTGDEALIRSSVCDVIASYVGQCQTRLGWQNDDVAPRWREILGCPCDYKREDITCSSQQTPSCLPSCTNQKAAISCDLPATFYGPKCTDVKKVLFRGECVEPSACGCVDENGRARSIKETWLSNNCTEERACVSTNKTTAVTVQCKLPNRCIGDQCIGCNQLTSVAFLIQNNALSCEKDWPYVKQLIADVIKLIKVGSAAAEASKVKVSLVTFAERAEVVVLFNGLSDMSTLLKKISALNCLSPSPTTGPTTTNLANGLKTIRDVIFGSERSSDINYLITFTSSSPNKGNYLVNAELYRLKVIGGVNLISLAVGGGASDLARATGLASQPAIKDKNVFLLSTYPDLASVRIPLKNALNLCFDDKPARCECYGDIHCSTFDNVHMDYQGLCPFKLLESNSQFGKFRINMKSLNLFNINTISFVEYLEIFFNDRVIKLRKKDPLTASSVVQALVDNNVVGIPSTFPGFSFRYNGNYVELLTSFGLIAALSQDWRSYVDLPRTFSYDTRGFCGNYDGDLDTDLVLANGTMYNSKINRGKTIGDSYVIQPANESCFLTKPLTSQCTTQAKKCFLLTNTSGVFGPCISAMGTEMAKTYQDECVLDFSEVCREELACKILEQFVGFCRGLSAEVVPASWRNATGCACTCGRDDMECLPRAPMCVNTCEEPNASDACSLPYGYDVCVCKDANKVLYQGTCIDRTRCGCLDEDQISHDFGSIWYNNQCTVKSTCQGNKKVLKETFTCPNGTKCIGAKCTACDPNPCENNGECIDDNNNYNNNTNNNDVISNLYKCKCPYGYYGVLCEKKMKEHTCQCQHGVFCRTFDGMELEFSTNKRWILAGNDEVEKNFTILARTYKLWEDSALYQDAYFRYIQVFIGSAKVHFEFGEVDQHFYSDLSVSVNNRRVQIPYKLNPNFSITYQGFYITLQSIFGLSVSVSTGGYVIIGISTDRSFSVYGFCGNNNEDVLDDGRTRNGKDEEDGYVIGESYVVEVDDEEEVDYEFTWPSRTPAPGKEGSCILDPGHCRDVFNRNDSPFLTCLKLLPAQYFESLVTRCTRNVRSHCSEAIFCRTVGELSHMCSTVVGGTSVKSWRSVFGCPCVVKGDLTCSEFGPPCINTCQDKDATKFCSSSSSVDDDSFILDSISCLNPDHVMSDYGVCVSRGTCGCVDEFGGGRKIGESWLSQDCSEQRFCTGDKDVVSVDFACGEGLCQDGYCRGCNSPIDVAFLIEESNSVCENDPTTMKGAYSVASCKNWQTMLKSVAETVKYLALNDAVRFALVRFSDQSSVVVPLNNAMTKKQLVGTIQNMTLQAGSRRLSQGVKVVRSQIFNGMPFGDRPNAPNLLILILLGKPTDPAFLLNHQLHEARISGMKLLVVGVVGSGSGVVVGGSGGGVVGWKSGDEEFLRQFARWSKQKSFVVNKTDDLLPLVSYELGQELSNCGPKMGTCSCSGSTRCLTFDLATFHHTVECPLLLVQLASTNHNLRVVLRNSRDPIKFQHSEQRVVIGYNGATVEFLNLNLSSYSYNVITMANDTVVELPYKSPDPSKFEIIYNGMNIEFVVGVADPAGGTSARGKIVVGVSQQGDAYVKLPSTFELLTSGLCGNFDDNPGNDYVTADGASNVASSDGKTIDDVIAMSHVVTGMVDSNQLANCQKSKPPKIPQEDCPKYIASKCEHLSNSSLGFKSCHELTPKPLKNYFYNGCVEELAVSCNVKTVCTVARRFVEFCREVGSPDGELDGWRGLLGCPCTCDSSDMTCYSSSTACVATCSSSSSSSSNSSSSNNSSCPLKDAVDVCVCSTPGQVLFKGRCVDAKNCGCISNADGSSHELGSSWLNEDCSVTHNCAANRQIVSRPFKCELDMQCWHGKCYYCQPINPCKFDGLCTETSGGYFCRCLPGFFGRNCEKKHDDGECSAWVGVNCLTFDGATLTSVTGLSRFLLAGSSSTKCPFKVYAKNYKPCNEPIAVVRYVEIVTGSNTFWRLERTKPTSDTTNILLTIGGQLVELPIITEQCSIQYVGNNVVFQSFCGLEVTFGATTLRIRVPNTLFGKLSGMCGNFDGDVTNDLSPSLLAFSMSDVNDLTDDDRADAVFDTCELNSIEDRCDDVNMTRSCGSMLETAFFQLCSKVLGKNIIDNFYQSCIAITDKVCHSQYNFTDVVCQIRRELVQTCRYLLGFDERLTRQLDPTNECDCPKTTDPSLKCVTDTTSPCVNTCSNPRAEDKCPSGKPAVFNVLKCSDPTKLFFKGSCVEPKNCGCLDEYGRPKEIGEQWLSQDCNLKKTCASPNNVDQTRFNCTPPNSCENSFCVGCDQPKDIFILLQSSFSICAADPTMTSDQTSCNTWDQVLQFLSMLLNPVKLGSDLNRVALVTVSDVAEVEFSLNEIIDCKQLQAKILSLKLAPNKFVYNITSGLSTLLDLFSTPEDRGHVPNHVIVVSFVTSSTGNDRDRAQVGGLLSRLEASRANVVSLGVPVSLGGPVAGGRDLGLDEGVVKSLSSAPSVRDRNYFLATSADDIFRLRVDVQNALNICDDRPSRCECYGDIHCSTFDNLHLDYQGLCEFLLVEYPPSVNLSHASFTSNFSSYSSTLIFSSSHVPPFKVFMKAFDLFNVKSVTFVQELKVVFMNYTIVLKKKNAYASSFPVIPSVNGLDVAVPSKHDNFRFRYNGNYVELVTDFKLVVGLNKDYKSYVELARDFSHKTWGFCGNYNGNAEDDAVLADGTLYTSKINRGKSVGNSYVVGFQSGVNENTCTYPGIPAEDIKCKMPSWRCDQLDNRTAGSVFSRCHAIINAPGQNRTATYQSECLLDLNTVCQDGIDCMVVEQYVSECRRLAGNDDVIARDWRKIIGCPCKCSQPDQVCLDVAAACLDTCLEPEASKHCDLPPLRDVCLCRNSSLTLFQGHCIAKEMCGCYDDAEKTEHEIGSTWMTKDCTELAKCNEDRSITRQPTTCRTGTKCYANMCTVCYPNPCQNGGTCEDITEDIKYRCTCPPGFYGKDCQLTHQQNTCNCFGNFRCLTFDRADLTYFGTCSFVLTDFKYLGRRSVLYVANDVGEDGSISRMVEVVGAVDKRILFIQDPQSYSIVTEVYVESSRVEIPYFDTNFQIRYNGMSTELVILTPNRTANQQTEVAILIGVRPHGGVYVTLNSPDLQTVLGGFCGNYDGDLENDLVTSDGRDVSGEENYGQLIGESYAVEGQNEECSLPTKKPPMTTPCKIGTEKCNQLLGNSTDDKTDSGVQQQRQEITRICNSKLPTKKLKFFHEACLDSLSENCMPKLTCKVLQAYIEECLPEVDDRSLLLRWREIFQCPCTCDSSDMTCVSEASACLATCASSSLSDPNSKISKIIGSSQLNDPCELGQARDVCVCSKAGQVLFKGRCVDPDRCGCVSPEDGVAHELGTTWLNSNCTLNNTCTLNREVVSRPFSCPGNLQCDTGSCSACSPQNPCQNFGTCVETDEGGDLQYFCICRPGFYGSNCQIETSTCQFFGNGHLVTFDGGQLDFLTPCKFTLVKVNNSRVKVANEYFAAHLRLSKRNGFYSVKYLEMAHGGYVVRLMRSYRVGRGSSKIDVTVNGQQVSNLPIKTKSFTLRPLSNKIQYESISGHVVSLSSDWLVEISLPVELRSSVFGLCGNFDGLIGNDYQTADGVDVADQRNAGSKIGRSYLVLDDPEHASDESCEVEITEEWAELEKKVPPSINDKCSLIGQFESCTSQLGVNLTAYYTRSCLIDGLVTCPPSGDDPSEDQMYCHSIEALVESCRRLQQPVAADWRSVFDCDCTCIWRDQVCLKPTTQPNTLPTLSGCLATCGDIHSEKRCGVAAYDAGCSCGRGKVLHNGRCISEVECACTDGMGTDREIGEQWYDDACTFKYTCTEPGTIVPEKTTQCGKHCKNDLITYLTSSGKK